MAGTDPEGECDTGVCDGSGDCAIGNHLWSARYGDADGQLPLAVAQDEFGNVVVSGSFMSTLNVGAGTMTSAGSSDFFLARFSSAGVGMVGLKYGDSAAQAFLKSATGPNGDIYLAGTFTGSVSFGGATLVSAGGFPFGDIAIAKVSTNGNHQWSDSYGDASPQVANGLAVDSMGDVVIVGHYSGTLDFGQPLLSISNNTEPFVAKLSSSGAYVWANRFGSSMGFESSRAVAVGPDDNIVVVGDFDDTITFGTTSHVAASAQDAFVVKFDASGGHQWSRRFGSFGSHTALAVAVDGAGRVAVALNSDGGVDFGGGDLPSAGGGDVAVALFDPAGNHLWSKKFGDAQADGVAAVAFDENGNVVLSGSFAGQIDFGAGPLQSAGGVDAFVVKLSATGVPLWAKRFGDTLDQLGLSVATGPGSTIAVTGALQGTMNLGGGALGSSGSPHSRQGGLCRRSAAGAA
ncbi:MAG: hypothetical protein KC731_15620, partial [Myxococcales bacterium]|nr:hypothetical protein [Myxococcales bacterium]